MIANLSKLLIVKRILLVSTEGIVYRKVQRIWILMLGCKGLMRKSHASCPEVKSEGYSEFN